MKKLYILLVAVLAGSNGFAQRGGTVRPVSLHVAGTNHSFSHDVPFGKLTAAGGDTFTLRHMPDTAGNMLYALGVDSGYVTGTNYWNDKAFAERFDVGDSGRNMQVIGMFAMFGGKVNPASTKKAVLKVWDAGARQMVSSAKFYNGFPNNVIDTLTVPVTQLGVGDTAPKLFMFPTATGNISTSFFAGYSIDYDFGSLNGDTIGLAGTTDGVRMPSNLFTYEMHISDIGDTSIAMIMNVQNATLETDNKWHDNYSDNDSIKNNLSVYPIVIMGFPVSTKGVTRNSFTLYGCYPNPAAATANVKFSLATGADVTVQLMDMSGRVVRSVTENKLAAGEHTTTLNVADLPAGQYLYLVRTSAGDGIAGKVTVE